MASGIITAILLACFVAGSFWVFSSRRNKEFEEAARLPLEDEMPANANESIAREFSSRGGKP
jgi:cytochrome c oxidase cbb3-type subunit 4